MEALEIIQSLAKADNIYAWFEQDADPKLVKAVRACAVPVRFEKGLAFHIFHSGTIGLNGNSQEIFRQLVSLPFVHQGSDDSYKYAPAARIYFDERLRNDGVDYAKLNGIIADYLAGERRVLVVNGVPEDAHPVRELKLREAYHTISADSEQGREKLDEFLSKSKGSDVLPDNWAASRICQYHSRYLPEWHLDAWYCEGRYHYLAGDYAKALPLLEEVRRSKRRSLIVAIADHFLGVIYRDYRKRRSLPDAAAVLEESVGIGREIPKLSHVAQALNTLGGVYQDQRRLKEAAEALEQARDIDRKLGNPASLAMTLNTLGGVYKDQRRLKEATEALEEARDIDKELGNPASLAMTLNTLGGVYKDQRRLPEAAQVLEEARDICEDLNDPASKAMVLNTLGGVYQDQRRLDEAAKALEEARDISETLNDRAQKAMVLNSLGGVYKDQRRLPEAAQVLEEARDICEDLNDPAQKAMVLNSLGGVYKDQRRLDEAAKALEDARDISETLNDQAQKAMVLNTLGNVYKDQGLGEKAEETLKEAIDLRRPGHDRLGLAMAYNLLGQLYGGLQRFGEAREAYQRSAEVNESRGDHPNARKMWAKVREMEENLRKG